MSFATREDILGKPLVRTYEPIEVQGHKFRIRSLTAGESNKVSALHMASESEEDRQKALASLPARYIVQCCVDEQGHRIFSDLDVTKILDLDAAFVQEWSDACQKVAGKKDVASAEKNSEPTPNSEPPTS